VTSTSNRRQQPGSDRRLANPLLGGCLVWPTRRKRCAHLTFSGTRNLFRSGWAIWRSGGINSAFRPSITPVIRNNVRCARKRYAGQRKLASPVSLRLRDFLTLFQNATKEARYGVMSLNGSRKGGSKTRTASPPAICSSTSPKTRCSRSWTLSPHAESPLWPELPSMSYSCSYSYSAGPEISLEADPSLLISCSCSCSYSYSTEPEIRHGEDSPGRGRSKSMSKIKSKSSRTIRSSGRSAKGSRIFADYAPVRKERTQLAAEPLAPITSPRANQSSGKPLPAC
jgi:hypothetical protein